MVHCHATILFNYAPLSEKSSLCLTYASDFKVHFFFLKCDIFLTNRLTTDYYVSWLGKYHYEQNSSVINTRLQGSDVISHSSCYQSHNYP